MIWEDANGRNHPTPTDPQMIAHFRRQWLQSCGAQPTITCGCGKDFGMRHLFRCLYCGCWFCQACGEVHFGKTRQAYAAERMAELAQEPQGNV